MFHHVLAGVRRRSRLSTTISIRKSLSSPSVIGDPSRRQLKKLADGNWPVEEYIGVAFRDGPTTPQAGKELSAVLTLYFPHPMYGKLNPGVSFTVREGVHIVGCGTVSRWLD